MLIVMYFLSVPFTVYVVLGMAVVALQIIVWGHDMLYPPA